MAMNRAALQYGVGIAGTAGDGVLVSAPYGAKYDGTEPAILLMHGHAGNATSFSPGNGDVSLGPHVEALVEAGYIVVSIDAGGNLWGSPTDFNIVTSAFRWMTSPVSTGGLGARAGKIGLLGYSMGGLPCLNWARRNPTLVAGISLFEPATNLTAFEQNSGFQSEVLSAYGATTANWLTVSAGWRPLDDAAAGLFTGLPFPIYIHHTMDDAVVAVADSQQFVANANDPGVTLTTLPSGLHGQAGSYWSPTDSVQFFAGLDWTPASGAAPGYFVKPVSATNAGSATSGTTQAVTVTSKPAVGNTLIMAIRSGSGTTPTSVTDSKGNAWVRDASNTGSNVRIALYRTVIADAAHQLAIGDTVTVTLGAASASISCVIMEYAGVLTASPIDQSSVATNSGSSTTVAIPATPPTTSPDDVVITAVGMANAGTATVAGTPTGWTPRDEGLSTARVHIADQRSWDTNTFSAQWTAGASQYLGGVTVAYKSAA